MMLADGGVTVIWIGGALLVGLAGAIVIVPWMIVRGLLRVLRALLGCGRRRQPLEPLHAAAPPRVCGQPRCGYLNRDAARYCARCGTSLKPPEVVNRHG